MRERDSSRKNRGGDRENDPDQRHMAYEDILHLPRHVSRVHPPMPMEERAAQFSPFAALTGYGNVIRETARLTEDRRELSDSVREELERKLAALADPEGSGKKRPVVHVTYFLPDQRKEGGAYVTASGRIRRVDGTERMLLMEDGLRIPLEEILDIEEKVSGLSDCQAEEYRMREGDGKRR